MKNNNTIVLKAEITENRVGRTTYRPGRINRTWPPPQDENQPPPYVSTVNSRFLFMI